MRLLIKTTASAKSKFQQLRRRRRTRIINKWVITKPHQIVLSRISENCPKWSIHTTPCLTFRRTRRHSINRIIVGRVQVVIVASAANPTQNYPWHRPQSLSKVAGATFSITLRINNHNDKTKMTGLAHQPLIIIIKTCIQAIIQHCKRKKNVRNNLTQLLKLDRKR